MATKLTDRWDFLGELADAWEFARGNLALTLRSASRALNRVREEVERWLTVLTLESDGALSASDGRFSLDAAGLLTLSGLLKAGNVVFTTASFDKTDTTLATVTGLSLTLPVGTWAFRAELRISADVGGGHKYSINGTATVSAVWFYILAVDNASGLNVIASPQTALGASANQIGSTGVQTAIFGVVTVTTAGTLVVEFAQAAAVGTSSVLTGASFSAW